MSVEKFYDNDSRKYDAVRENRYFEFLNGSEADVVRKYCGGKKVLEIGCGTGLLLEELAGDAGEIEGIDLSGEMVAKTKAKGFKAQKADAQELPFEDETFDVAYSFKVLPHVPDLGKALSEAARVVKSNGMVIFELYNPFSIKRLSDACSNRYKNVFTRYYRFGEIKTLMPDELELVDVKGIRIVTVFAKWMSVPVVGNIFLFLEKVLGKTFFKYLGSYFVIVSRKR